MDLKDALTWAGGDVATWSATLLTGIGVVASWWQAHRARSAASDAKKIRDDVADEIAQRGAHGELSELYNHVTKAVDVMDKYGPGAKLMNQRGSKIDEDASVVRKLTTLLSLHKAMLEKSFNDIAVVQDSINELLNEFASAQTDLERLKKGALIHRQLADLGGNLKKAIDGHVYR